MSKDTRPKCPLCKDRLNYHPLTKNKKEKTQTHFWHCIACPFVGFEYYNNQDVTAVKKYINL